MILSYKSAKWEGKFIAIITAAVMALCTAAVTASADTAGAEIISGIYSNSFDAALSANGAIEYGVGGRKPLDSSFCYSGLSSLNDQLYTSANLIGTSSLVLRASFLFKSISSDITFQPVSNGNSVFANMVIFGGDGKIKTGASKAVISEYETGIWYQITVVVKTDLSYSLYINGEIKDTSGLKFSNNINDSNTFEGISRVKILSSGSSAVSSFGMDDFDFYIGGYDENKSKSTAIIGTVVDYGGSVAELEGIVTCNNEFWFFDAVSGLILNSADIFNENTRLMEKAEDGLTLFTHKINLGYGKITYDFENGKIPWAASNVEKAGTQISVADDNGGKVLSLSGSGQNSGTGKTVSGDSYVTMPYIYSDYEFELDVKNLYPANGDAQIVLRDTRALADGDAYIILAKFSTGSNNVRLFSSLTTQYTYSFSEITWHHIKINISGKVITLTLDYDTVVSYDCGALLFDFNKYSVRLQATTFSVGWTDSYANAVYYDNITVPGGKNVIGNAEFNRLYNNETFKVDSITPGVMRCGANISVYNDSLKKAYSLTAVYENQILKNISCNEFNLDYGDNSVFGDVTVNTTENTKVKTFIFKDLNNLKPLTAAAEAEKGLIENVTPAEIYEKIMPQHPRILADSNTFSQILTITAENDNYSALMDKVITGSANYLTRTPPIYEKPDGLRLSPAYTIESALLNLMFLYKATGNTVYADKAIEYIETGLSYPNWNTSHFLDTAAMANGFGIAYDWGYDYFSTELKEQMAQAMVNYALNPALSRYKASTYGWDRMNNNWNFVCNEGMAVAALAIAEEYPELCGQILAYSINSLKYCLAALEPDGGWYEGFGYWHYGVKSLITEVAALESATGETYNIMNDGGMSKTGYFPLYSEGATGLSFNYADGGESSISVPSLLYFGKYYNNDDFINARIYQLMAKNKSPQYLDMIWLTNYSGRLSAPAYPQMSLMKYFSEDETVTMRSAWGDVNALFAGIHGGSVNVNHGQMDKGQFIFEANNIRWAIDLGSDNYNLYKYFDNAYYRWYYYRNRAEGHNTLIINPSAHTLYEQNLNATAKVNLIKQTTASQIAVLDLTKVYEDDVNSAVRGIKLDTRNKNLVVQDEMNFKNNSNEIYWFMHTMAGITIAANGKSAILESGGERVYVQILGANTMTFSQMDAVPLETSPDPDALEENINNGNNNPTAQNINSGIKKLYIHQTGVASGSYTISVSISPLAAGESYPNSTATLKAIASW